MTGGSDSHGGFLRGRESTLARLPDWIYEQLVELHERERVRINVHQPAQRGTRVGAAPSPLVGEFFAEYGALRRGSGPHPADRDQRAEHPGGRR